MNEFSSDDLRHFYKSNVSTLFLLTSEIFEGVQKLAELNLQTGRSVLSESVARLKEVNPDTASADWLASPLRLLQSAADRTLSYQQQVHAIAVATQSASAKILDAQHDQFSRDVQGRIDNWATHAPAGSETAVIALKSAFSTASNAAETVRKAVRSFVEVAQSNVSAMAASASRNTALQSGASAGKS